MTFSELAVTQFVEPSGDQFQEPLLQSSLSYVNLFHQQNFPSKHKFAERENFYLADFLNLISLFDNRLFIVVDQIKWCFFGL